MERRRTGVGEEVSNNRTEMIRENTQFKKGHIPANKKELVAVICKQCLVESQVQPYRKNTAKFCSISCKAKFNMHGSKHHQWKGGLPKCLDCGKVLSNYNNKKCSEHRGMRGKDNPKWISDRTLLKDDTKERGGQLHREWSKNVKNRDNWKCKISNSDCYGRIEAHHILGWTAYPELRYDINNGITLCHAHHPRKRIDEAKLSPFFQSLVAEMN